MCLRRRHAPLPQRRGCLCGRDAQRWARGWCCSEPRGAGRHGWLEERSPPWQGPELRAPPRRLQIVRLDRSMEQIIFPVPGICEFLTKETKYRLFTTTEQDEQGSKVSDFFDQSSFLHNEMEWQKKLRSKSKPDLPWGPLGQHGHFQQPPRWPWEVALLGKGCKPGLHSGHSSSELPVLHNPLGSL